MVDALLKLAYFPLLVAFQFGEVILVGCYIVIPLIKWTRPHRTSAPWRVTIICVGALVLHCFGFKLYGRPVLASLERLDHPQRIARLERPNLVQFEDGSRVALSNVFFPRSIDPRAKQDSHYESARGGGRVDLLFEHADPTRGGIPVEIVRSNTASLQLTYLRGASYGCGNTWTPRFFPSRLPRKVRGDFAELLIAEGLALPTADHVLAAKGNDGLVRALHRRFTRDVPKGDEEIIRLGSALVQQSHWHQGIELLVLTRATNLFSQYAVGLQNEYTSLLRDGYRDTYRSNALRLLLFETKPDGAKAELSRLISSEPLDGLQVCLLASAMARADDMSGFDLIMTRLKRMKSGSKEDIHLARLAASCFRFDLFLSGGGFPDDFVPEFLTWYETVRPKLSYRYSLDHREGFGFESGEPFSSGYYESMQPFKADIAKRMGQTLNKERFYD